MTDSETPGDRKRDECDDAPDVDASVQEDDAESDQPARRIVVPGSGGKADAETAVDRLGLLKFDASMFANFTSLYTPSIDFSRFADWGHSPALADLSRRIAEQTMASAPLYSPTWFEAIVDALRESAKGWNFPDLADLVRPALPANIMEADIDYEPDEWMTWISEGLVIAWVPDAGTLELIAAADTPAGRRSAVSTRVDEVLESCKVLLDQITAADYVPFVEPVRRAIAGIRADFSDLAQAYAASTLETIVAMKYGRYGHYRQIESEHEQAQLFRSELHLAQLIAVFRSFTGNDVPTTFNRHATVHDVTHGKQYSRLNAVLAVGHLVSVLWKYELDTRDAHHEPDTAGSGSGGQPITDRFRTSG
ncbi:hypothetical protein [Curtobacterium flaccumfaciens]|uniref:hypothetical protein n=1 Tax=Curtobacterium flaccumfaciens TaxID=2035 RepID=UPI001BDEA350|nr:hypothetical protein [Curtobacterium flaccumfaciens]MBT1631522.1 hypothetical protein [Curtobacterium flaccumfaciens pv. oortii]MCX2846830.1 hypothetical protein [Curtobacterium flaccumfaciens pv. oortii]